MANDLGPILSAAYPQVVATLIRVLGDMDRAMDATQDALVKALQVWASEGVPDNPVAWLVTVGRNRAVDQLRREQRSISLDSNVVPLVAQLDSVDLTDSMDAAEWLAVDDDMLRLLFTCCHPELSPPAQMVLMLKVVLGFSTAEIARGLLASPASIEKRITRAKQQLKRATVPYEVPPATEIPARVDAVLKAIYLIFNEGYTRFQDAGLSRGSLIDIAIRLGRMVSRLLRNDPEPRSLLALMLLSAARLNARVDEHGVFVPLEEQDRSRWHKGMIDEGVALIDTVFAARHIPGAYQIQAAISAIHSQAASAAETDWPQIAALYNKLAQLDASPVVPVNQAVALCYCGKADQALTMLTAPELSSKLISYQPYFAALSFAYECAGQEPKSIDALQRACELADSSAQRVYLQRRLQEKRAVRPEP